MPQYQTKTTSNICTCGMCLTLGSKELVVVVQMSDLLKEATLSQLTLSMLALLRPLGGSVAPED